jgi:hypothetical protein
LGLFPFGETPAVPNPPRPGEAIAFRGLQQVASPWFQGAAMTREASCCHLPASHASRSTAAPSRSAGGSPRERGERGEMIAVNSCRLRSTSSHFDQTPWGECRKSVTAPIASLKRPPISAGLAQGATSHLSHRSRASTNAISSSRRSGTGIDFVSSPPRQLMACSAGGSLAKSITSHRSCLTMGLGRWIRATTTITCSKTALRPRMPSLSLRCAVSSDSSCSFFAVTVGHTSSMSSNEAVPDMPTCSFAGVC